MDKISSAQAAEMVKIAADEIRNLNNEVQGLRSKVAHYEKRERAEKLAYQMEEKGFSEGLSFQEKVASLMDRDDLNVVEEALNLNAPQVKLASVSGMGVDVEHGENYAEQQFLANLSSLD